MRGPWRGQLIGAHRSTLALAVLLTRVSALNPIKANWARYVESAPLTGRVLEVRSAPRGLLLVIPGIGSASRATRCASNVKLLFGAGSTPNGRPWVDTCIAFTHKRFGEDGALDAALNLSTEALPSVLTRKCEIVRASNREPGGSFADHLKRVLPTFVETSGFSAVFVLFDDVLLPPNFDLPRFLRVTSENSLNVSSPAIRGASYPSFMDVPSANILRPQLAVGRLVRFIEFFALLFSPSAWRCMYDLVDSTNSMWGYDGALYHFCRRRFAGAPFRMGLIDEVVATHGNGVELHKLRQSTYKPSTADRQMKAWRELYDKLGLHLSLEFPTPEAQPCWLCYPARDNERGFDAATACPCSASAKRDGAAHSSGSSGLQAVL